MDTYFCFGFHINGRVNFIILTHIKCRYKKNCILVAEVINPEGIIVLPAAMDIAVLVQLFGFSSSFHFSLYSYSGIIHFL